MKGSHKYIGYYIGILLAVVFETVNSNAQDIHFSQFFEAPLLRNPSLAGLFKGDIRVQGVYRDQWNSFTDAYRTASINGEYKMPIGKSNDFITAGVQILYDRAGTIGWTTTHLLPALNYHKSLSNEKNTYLSLGFMGGWVQNRFDASKATTNSQYDNNGLGETFGNRQYNYIDASVGMSLNSYISGNPENNYFLGAAYHHFNRPRNSFYYDPAVEIIPKWVFSAGVKLEVSESAYLTIQADHTRQGTFRETVAGALVGFKLGDDTNDPTYTIHAGGFLRWNDAFIPVIKLDYFHTSISFSYDANISSLKPTTSGRGGYEISISWYGIRKDKGEYLLCPRF
jgi:type IX secretion system PorP/SprF family membrane protein